MLHIPRIIIECQLTYENIDLYEHGELADPDIPTLFEHETIVFTKGNQTFTLPETNIIYLEYKKGRTTPPPDGIYFRRITLSYEITFADGYIIAECCYEKYNIPHIFKQYKQLAFMDRHGIYITTDDQIILIQLT